MGLLGLMGLEMFVLDDAGFDELRVGLRFLIRLFGRDHTGIFVVVMDWVLDEVAVGAIIAL